jgi:hypothetical protein
VPTNRNRAPASASGRQSGPAHAPARPEAPPASANATFRVMAGTSDGYELPVVHLRLPERAVNLGFWGVLLGSAALGIVDPPLAALIGAGVLIARHRR